jgi:hypothetical protein
LGAKPVKGNSRGYAGLVLLPWLFGLMAYWIIVAIDPYELRRAHPPYQLAEHRYPDDEWTRLLNVVTSEPHDAILLGGSTAMAIDQSLLREAFPGALNPVNLSYVAPRPPDMPLILPKIARIPGLKHIVLFMDFTLMEKGQRRSPSGDIWKSFRDTDWSHGGDFGLTTALASLHAVANGTYDLNMWSAIALPDYMIGGAPLTQSFTAIQRFKETLRSHGDDVFASSGLSCGQIPYLKSVLEPFPQQMTNRHIAVDLVFPPVPYVLYYDWMDHRPPSHDALIDGPVFDQFMTFEKCVVATIDPLGAKDIRVLALDANDKLSGDLGHYFDTLHLIDPAAYQLEAHMIANGDGQITSANFEQHEAELRAKVSRWAAAQIGAH